MLFVTHEIDEALTVATRIAVLAPRPTAICQWFDLPGPEGRTPPPLSWPGAAKRSSGESLVITSLGCHGNGGPQEKVIY